MQNIVWGIAYVCQTVFEQKEIWHNEFLIETDFLGGLMKDTIYRQDAIDAIDSLPNCYNGFSDSYDKAYIIGVLEELSSAEPNIIRCKDCKWKQGSECVRFADVRPFPDDFCSRAERREDEGHDIQTGCD